MMTSGPEFYYSVKEMKHFKMQSILHAGTPSARYAMQENPNPGTSGNKHFKT